ncbi:DUF2312 domain-containing protein [Sphingosinithalassobacter tenebrarum]|uniref:DUF2312 domain-containing protein n=2 Tax=Stakelama tenebrarum TaxID=2711215 RepID=A0A6G6YAB9_9SPHN|nr:DUF2312 domain-containing protein [Sphingosinithalassobacter tenebrarum]
MGERAAISEDIRSVYSEAKADGFDAGTIRRLIARMEMAPDDREEADALLATYEAAIGGLIDAEAERRLTDTRPDAAAIALEMLTADIVGLEDEARAAALVEHVTILLDIRAEIAVLRGQERARKAMAKDEGFDAKQIGATVHWFEKCVKHGEDAMRAAEATFHLYRGTVEADRIAPAAMSDRDRGLMAKFAGRDPAAEKRSAARKRLSGTIATLNAMDAATRRGGGHG